MAEAWHSMPADLVAERLGVDVGAGLSLIAAQERLARYGPNELEDRSGKSAALILRDQVSSVMVAILLVAAAISVVLGDLTDAVAIGAIVTLNVLLGFRQEYRAEKAMAALQRMAAPRVPVRRDRQVRSISARSLVPGDVAMLDAGSRVPADGRLVEVHNLRVQEAALTGESAPVTKEVDSVGDAATPLGDRRSMVYMGTVVTYGRGEFVVTSTGMRSELGRVAHMLQGVGVEPTPLQRRLDQLGRRLGLAALMLVAVVFSLGVARGEDVELMFLTAVSLAVAAVPEGLPAVVTIALALGGERMLRRRALIRRLPAVETLGSVTVICSDKTGTLTANLMSVTILDAGGREVALDGPPGRSLSAESPLGPDSAALVLLLAGGALCNDAVLEPEGPGEQAECAVSGDPTEAALVSAAARQGLDKSVLEKACPRIGETPFDSTAKRMTTINRLGDFRSGAGGIVSEAVGLLFGCPPPRAMAFTKGAVDVLLGLCDRVVVGASVTDMSPEWRERLGSANDRMADRGMRVLGLAVAASEEKEPDSSGAGAEGSTFVGLFGLIDPPRQEARDAVRSCLEAGVRPVMITGDHPCTARHIADDVGIETGGGLLTGQALSALAPEELSRQVEQVSVYARVAPEHKLAIVRSLQEKGHIVAMTGDGVNDAPALRRADIGVAMGVTGTDVSKEAADMVLLDDNFATIVAAIEEGRVVYDNIRKFVRYIITSNSGELSVMIAAPFLGLPLPLFPLQILWINLVTDGLPALALSLEPAEEDVMRRPPHPPAEGIFARGLGVNVLWAGLLIGLVSLSVGYVYWAEGRETWQTQVFTTLTLSQMALALAIRTEGSAFRGSGPLGNKALLGSVLVTFVLQLAVVYTPFLQGVFRTHPLSAGDLLLALALSTVVFWAVEIHKRAGAWRRRKATVTR